MQVQAATSASPKSQSRCFVYRCAAPHQCSPAVSLPVRPWPVSSSSPICPAKPTSILMPALLNLVPSLSPPSHLDMTQHAGRTLASLKASLPWPLLGLPPRGHSSSPTDTVACCSAEAWPPDMLHWLLLLCHCDMPLSVQTSCQQHYSRASDSIVAPLQGSAYKA